MIETFSDTRTEIGPDGPQEYWRVEISSHYWRDLNSQTLIPTKEKILFWDTIFCALCAIIFAFGYCKRFLVKDLKLCVKCETAILFSMKRDQYAPPTPLLPLALYHPLANVSIVPT